MVTKGEWGEGEDKVSVRMAGRVREWKGGRAAGLTSLSLWLAGLALESAQVPGHERVGGGLGRACPWKGGADREEEVASDA